MACHPGAEIILPYSAPVTGDRLTCIYIWEGAGHLLQKMYRQFPRNYRATAYRQSTLIRRIRLAASRRRANSRRTAQQQLRYVARTVPHVVNAPRRSLQSLAYRRILQLARNGRR